MAEQARLNALNPAPGLRYTPRDNEGGGGDPILTGYDTAGNVGYYSKVQTGYGGESGGDTYDYVWNPSQYDYKSEAFTDPLAKYVTNNLDPSQVEDFYSLKTTNPNEYYNSITGAINDIIFMNWRKNKSERNEPFINDLESIKEINPNAYYNAKLQDYGRQMGWQAGQNRSDNYASLEKELTKIIPDAINAGINPDQINSILGSNINNFKSYNQSRIANEASQGNFWTENLLGTAKVGALAAGAYGLDTALAAAASAAGNAAGTLTVPEILASTGFTPAAGSGASFALPGLASTAPLTTAELLSSSGFTPNAGASFAIDPTAAYTTAANVATGAPVYDYSQPFSFEQMGPSYQELGVTGVEGGMAGPTYGELGYSGLNQSEAIAAAEAASKGLTGADALKYANQARQGLNAANTLAKLLGGSAGAASGVKSANSSSGLNSLANLLRPTAQTSDYLGQIKANQNPFTFTSPGQTVASPGMYDVSGSNMANALRKA
jgi:hypothetical protein